MLKISFSNTKEELNKISKWKTEKKTATENRARN